MDLKTLFADMGVMFILLLLVVGCGWLGAWMEDLAEKQEEEDEKAHKRSISSPGGMGR
jgi:Tfp pilus assembly protein PilO